MNNSKEEFKKQWKQMTLGEKSATLTVFLSKLNVKIMPYSHKSYLSFYYDMIIKDCNESKKLSAVSNNKISDILKIISSIQKSINETLTLCDEIEEIIINKNKHDKQLISDIMIKSLIHQILTIQWRRFKGIRADDATIEKIFFFLKNNGCLSDTYVEGKYEFQDIFTLSFFIDVCTATRNKIVDHLTLSDIFKESNYTYYPKVVLCSFLLLINKIERILNLKSINNYSTYLFYCIPSFTPYDGKGLESDSQVKIADRRGYKVTEFDLWHTIKRDWFPRSEFWSAATKFCDKEIELKIYNVLRNAK